MAVDYYSGRIVRGVIQNLVTSEELMFQFNPQRSEGSIEPNYARQAPIAGTAERLHWRFTANAKRPLELRFSLMDYVDRHRGAGEGALSQAALKRIAVGFEDQRNFFHAFAYPAGPENDPLSQSPPKALLLWPNHVAMEAVVTSYRDTDTLFNLEQQTRMFSVFLNLEELRKWRLTSATARRIGWKRYGVRQGGGG
jgi:hypothetical protein